jgi:hypothetical protein
VISSSQRPLPTQDNTTYKQQTNIHAPSWIRSRAPATERPQTYALDGAATGGRPIIRLGSLKRLSISARLHGATFQKTRTAHGKEGICEFLTATCMKMGGCLCDAAPCSLVVLTDVSETLLPPSSASLNYALCLQSVFVSYDSQIKNCFNRFVFTMETHCVFFE